MKGPGLAESMREGGETVHAKVSTKALREPWVKIGV